jgi:hypothetical protein
MSDSGQDLSRLVGELVRTVEELQSELDEGGPRPRLRPPTPGELARFTSEVTIPAVVLALETNVRALKLLQRALRLGTDTQAKTSGAGGSEAADRARALGRTTLSRLDDAFADLQDALDGRPPDDRTRELLDEARDVRARIDEALADDAVDPGGKDPHGDQAVGGTEGRVEIDVDSELQSIKDDLDAADGAGGAEGGGRGGDGGDGDDTDGDGGGDDEGPGARRDGE